MSGAEAALRKAVRLDATMVDGHAALAGLLLNRGDVGGATASCKKALELYPDHPHAVEVANAIRKQQQAQK